MFQGPIILKIELGESNVLQTCFFSTPRSPSTNVRKLPAVALRSNMLTDLSISYKEASHWSTLRCYTPIPRTPTWSNSSSRVSRGILNLVGGLEYLLFLHILRNVIIPTDEVIFFRGVGRPPTSWPLGGKDYSGHPMGYSNKLPDPTWTFPP